MSIKQKMVHSVVDKDHYKNVKQILWLILFLNLLVAAAKMLIGSMIASAAMFADGVHSLSDGSSNVVGLIGIGFASKPVDEDHPYGHNKFETMSGLFIAIMLLLVAGTIIKGSIGKLIEPSVPSVSAVSLVVLGVTLCINIFVAVYEFKKGKALGSLILISDSLHTKSDIFVTIGVFTALAAIKLGAPPIIDPLVSLMVAALILKAAYGIFKETNGILTDKAAEDSKKIEEVARSFSEVEEVHKIRSRGTLNCIYIDMHIQVCPDMTVADSHRLIHEIDERIKVDINPNAQTIIHIEPYYTDRSREYD